MNSPASPPGLWRRFTAAYARFLTGLLAFSVAIIIIPVTLQMVSRYTALIPSYIWTEEMARFLFIWMIMIGAMIGVREASHFEVDVWPTLPRRGEAAVRIVARLGILAFAIVFLVGAGCLMAGALLDADRTAVFALGVMLAGFPVQWAWRRFVGTNG